MSGRRKAHEDKLDTQVVHRRNIPAELETPVALGAVTRGDGARMGGSRPARRTEASGPILRGDGRAMRVWVMDGEYAI